MRMGREENGRGCDRKDGGDWKGSVRDFAAVLLTRSVLLTQPLELSE